MLQFKRNKTKNNFGETQKTHYRVSMKKLTNKTFQKDCVQTDSTSS